MAVIKSGSSNHELIVDSSGAAYIKLLNSNDSISSLPPGNAVSTLNSTITTLATLNTFTGTAEDVHEYNSIIISCLTDQAGTLYAEFSIDGSNWDSSLSYNVAAATNEVHRLTITRKYFRVRFYNSSASNQTYLRLQTIYGNQVPLTSPLSNTIQGDSDSIIVRESTNPLDLARGLLSNMTTVNKFGKNTDIDIGTEDVWGVGGTWVQPTSAGVVNIASSDVNDTSAGTGARTISVNGLNGSYEEVTETVTLNGTSNVATVNSYFIIHRIIVLTAGSGGTNAGTITAVSTGGGTPTMCNITIGKAQTQFCIYQVPSGYTAYLSRFGGSVNGGANLDLELFVKPFGGVFNLKGALSFAIGSTTEGAREYKTPLRFTEKSIIKLTGTASANNTNVVGNFDLILVQN